MIISDRIFELLAKKKMTQKEFSQRTGIPQSTISDWKKKRTDPSAEKIMLICEILGVSPEYLLSGTEAERKQGRTSSYVVARDSELGELIQLYQTLDVNMRERLMGYVAAISSMS